MTSPSVIPPGNVQQLADWVQEETGGDLFSIKVEDPYPVTGMNVWNVLMKNFRRRKAGAYGKRRKPGAVRYGLSGIS